jgi:hypothetical protein
MTWLTRVRPQLVGRGWLLLTGLGVVVALFEGIGSTSYLNGYDFLAYWAVDAGDPYRVHVAPAAMAFLYAPPIAFLFDPLGMLPFEVGRIAWGAGQAFVLALMAGPLTLPLAIVGPVHDDLVLGNIGLFMAVAIWAGLGRWPEAWAFPILSKVTPVVGLAWYVGKGDWRGLARALGATAIVAGATLLVAPGLWIQWLDVLALNASVSAGLNLGPLWLRILMAALACGWAGRTTRPWVVPIAVALSLGHPWLPALSVATASIPLWHSSRRKAVAPAPVT